MYLRSLRFLSNISRFQSLSFPFPKTERGGGRASWERRSKVRAHQWARGEGHGVRGQGGRRVGGEETAL